jgi:hypothetical protein
MAVPDWRTIRDNETARAQRRLDDATESSGIRALVQRIKDRSTADTTLPEGHRVLLGALQDGDRFGFLRKK